MIHGTDVVVLSHLRWNFVYQRPQHVLSRLAAYARVIFIEEPLPGTGEKLTFEISEPQPNVTVVRPHSPAASPGFSNEQLELLKPRLQEFLGSQSIHRFCAWLYTPMALPLLDGLRPELVIYDCMDALDAFLHAPPELRLREEALLRRADVVFTGGPSLYKRLQGRHGNVHCFPSSVDARHFAQAQDVIAEPPDQEPIGMPLLVLRKD